MQTAAKVAATSNACTEDVRKTTPTPPITARVTNTTTAAEVMKQQRQQKLQTKTTNKLQTTIKHLAR